MTEVRLPARKRGKRAVAVSTGVLIAVVAVGLALLLPVARSGRPVVELADLVPLSPPPSDGLVWRPDPGIDTSSRGETFGAVESRRAAWLGSDRGPVLVQTLHRYAGPLSAEYHYRLSGPGQAFRDDYPAYSGPAERFSSRHADRTQVVCAAIDPGRPCQIWFYWARYGQYSMQLRYQGNPKIDGTTFLRYVRYFDDHVGQQLG